MLRSLGMVVVAALAGCYPDNNRTIDASVGDDGAVDGVVDGVVSVGDPAPAPHSTITVTPSSAVVGTDGIAIVVVLRDVRDQPVAGWNLAFAATGARNTLAPGATCTTDVTGTCSAALASLTAEAKSIDVAVAASAGGDPATSRLFTLDASVSFVAGSASAVTSSATPSPTMLHADGRETTTITLAAFDEYGNPVADATVMVEPTGNPYDTFGATTGTTDPTGGFATTLASRTVGTRSITFMVGGVSITSSPIQFLAAPWSQANGTMWGGDVRAIAMPPAGGPAGLAYAATANGVYKTTDGGQNWKRSSFGLDSALITDIAVASLDGSLVLATVYNGDSGHGLYRSSDSGATWTLALGGSFTASQLAVHVDASGGLLAYVLDATNAVYRSTDGVTWASAGALAFSSGPVPTAMVIDPRNDVVYIAADTVYSNAGGTWAAAGTGLPPYGQSYIRSMAIDVTSDPAVVWVGTGMGVYRGAVTTSHAMTFSSAGGPGFDTIALAADPVAAGTVYAASFAQVYRTTDGGVSWARLSALAQALDPITRIAIDPSRDSTAWVVSCGYPYSTWSGSRAPWKSTNITAAPDTVAAVPQNAGLDAQGGRLLQQHPTSPSTLAVASSSLWQTTDGAATWTDLVAAHGSTVPLSASSWLGVGYDATGTLYAMNGSSVVRVSGSNPLSSAAPTRYLQTFGVSPAMTGTFFGMGYDGVFSRCTSPCSAGWTSVPLPAGMYPLGLAFGRSAGAQGQAPIYAYGQGGIAKSIDGGVTFTSLSTFAGVYIRFLSVDPIDADRIAISPLNGGLFLSSDGGATFTNIGASLPSGTEGLVAIDSRSTPITLYFSPDSLPGRQATLLRSSDGGTTWTPANAGLAVTSFAVMWPDVQSPGNVVYAGSWTRGIFKTTTGGL